MRAVGAPLIIGALAAALLVLLWDVLLAGWIAKRREAPRLFTALTGFCGLLVAPALVVAVATGTVAGSRTVAGVSWLLPLVTCAFVLQVISSMVLRLVSPVVAIPILLYDLALAGIAVGDYLISQHGAAPVGLQGLVAARDVVLGMSLGRVAMVSPLALLVPIISPAYPARWRLSRLVRASLVLTATAVSTLLLLEWPRGIGAVRSYASARAEPLQSRPAGDFVLGLRVLPTLSGPPPARLVKPDFEMVTRFAPDIVFVQIDGDGSRASALDSLARVLEPLRDDSVRIAVALVVDAHTAADRNRAIERILLRVRPDVLFPAYLPPTPSLLPSAPPSQAWWRVALREGAATVARVRPRTLVAWSASRLDATDSAVFAWASSGEGPVQIVGAAPMPSFSGLPAVDARLRAFERWHQRAVDDSANAPGARSKRYWLVTVAGMPHAHGDAAQFSAIRHALAWGSRRSWISAAIIGEPADYEGWTGLRASNGRERTALSVLAAINHRFRDIRPTDVGK